jgi:acetyl esterase/lipase
VNQTVDVVLPGSLMRNNELYAGGADLSDPSLSPLFGNHSGFPPNFLQSGTRDLFFPIPGGCTGHSVEWESTLNFTSLKLCRTADF